MSISRNLKFPVHCPECGREHKISMDDIARQITIPCDCGKEIKIIDEGGKGKAATKDFEELERLLKDIGGSFRIG